MVDVVVRNFQAVKEAKFRIEGITVIQGESNAGKTAVVRALYAAMHNRFKSRQVRYGESAAEIKLRFSDTQGADGKPLILSVKRSFTGGSPIYVLGDKRWSKLNRDMPNEVLSYLNLGRVNVSNSEFYSLNFFKQNQAPLLAEFSQKKVMDVLSASQSVDDLNKVRKEIDIRRTKNRGAFEQLDAILTESKVNLTQVNLVISESSSLFEKGDDLNVKILSSQEKVKDLNKLKKELKEYVSLKQKTEVIRKLISLKESQVMISSKLSQYRNLSSLVKKMPRVEKEKDLLVEFGAIKMKCDKLYSKSYSLEELAMTIRDSKKLSLRLSLLSKLSELLESGQKTNVIVTNLRVLKNSLLQVKTYSRVIQDITKVLKLKETVLEFELRVKEVKSKQQKLAFLKEKLSNYSHVRSEYDRITNIFNNNLCPVCERPLGDTDHSH